MRKLIAIFVAFLVSAVCYADISVRVLSIEKETRADQTLAKVSTEYILPDGTKKVGVTRYTFENFTKANVVTDIKSHAATILKYYISENRTAINTAIDAKITKLIDAESKLAAAQRIVGVTYTVSGDTDTATGVYMKATGTVIEAYK